tara:strand:- start:668 stop:829 length:162 start_codon:yes stop_codon:yes gene_type:complete
MLNFLEGKKTYIVAIIAAVLSVLPTFGIEVPEQVYGVLAALGLATVRNAITKS